MFVCTMYFYVLFIQKKKKKKFDKSSLLLIICFLNLLWFYQTNQAISDPALFQDLNELLSHLYLLQICLLGPAEGIRVSLDLWHYNAILLKQPGIWFLSDDIDGNSPFWRKYSNFFLLTNFWWNFSTTYAPH